MAILRSDSTIGGKSIDNIVYHDDIPRVYLTGGLLPITKDNQTMKMKYESKTLNFEAWITIKCQGTSSMAYSKKNFSIRLYEDEALTTKLKMDFNDWGPQYKFVWKANFIDITHARNIVSARLWADCVKSRSTYDQLPELLRTSPNEGAIDGFFIKVYYEGLYQGRYTWNIPKDPWMTNMDETLDEHCLLCGEDYVSGCFRAEALIDESDWTDEIHAVVPESIKTRWNEVINFVMTSSDEDFKANLDSYIDVESIIDYYLFHYVCCGLDALGKNQVYITYDGQKWYATSYDMDSTWGLYWDGGSVVTSAYRMQRDYETGVHGTSNLLIDRLEKMFKQEIYDRYQVLRSGPLTVEHIISRFEDFMICDEELVKEDYAIFTDIPGTTINNLHHIRQYAVDRLHYVDDCIEAFVAPEVTAGILYELPSETTFDGTSTYIDTGIKLFDTAKDWTIICYGYMSSVSQSNNTTIIQCMDESGSYHGLTLQWYESGYSMLQNNKSFQDHGTMKIYSNSFKFAITCKDGNLQTFKIKNYNGIETYKAIKCSYQALDKTLTLGAYQDDEGNYSRYWAGTMYSFTVYDSVLTGGQINNLLKNIGVENKVLVDGYSAGGKTFSYTANIDWDTQELYVTMNLTACTGTNECLLSVGSSIADWTWEANNFHVYYTASTDVLAVDAKATQGVISLSNITGDLTLRFNTDGLYINGTLYSIIDYSQLGSVLGLDTIEIGSTNGTVRSKATAYHIEIRDKQ